jgi:hypothetical protein
MTCISGKEDGNQYSSDRYGLVNNKGEIVVKPRFAWIEPFSGANLTAVREDDGYAYLKSAGRSNGKYGYVDNEGRYVIDPKFDKVYRNFDSSNLSLVQQETKKGYINTNGEFVFYYETVCGTEVVKNGKDEIIYPKTSVEELCKNARTD